MNRSKAINLGAHAIHLYLGLRDKCEDIFPTEKVKTLQGEVKRSADAALVEIWGQGGIEFSQFLADVAADIDNICRRSYKVMSDWGYGFPGVFEYEVNEPVGADIAVWLKENQKFEMDALKALAEDSLLRHAREYLHQDADSKIKREIDEILDLALPAAAKRLNDWVAQRDAETQKEAASQPTAEVPRESVEDWARNNRLGYILQVTKLTARDAERLLAFFKEDVGQKPANATTRIEVGTPVFAVAGTSMSHGKVVGIDWRAVSPSGAPAPAVLVRVQLDNGLLQSVTVDNVFLNQCDAVCAFNRNLDAQPTK